VCIIARLKPGFYLIVPSIDKPDINLEFVLKILTAEPTEIM
jgi:hypothetical protein